MQYLKYPTEGISQRRPFMMKARKPRITFPVNLFLFIDQYYKCFVVNDGVVPTGKLYQSAEKFI